MENLKNKNTKSAKCPGNLKFIQAIKRKQLDSFGLPTTFSGMEYVSDTKSFEPSASSFIKDPNQILNKLIIEADELLKELWNDYLETEWKSSVDTDNGGSGQPYVDELVDVNLPQSELSLNQIDESSIYNIRDIYKISDILPDTFSQEKCSFNESENLTELKKELLETDLVVELAGPSNWLRNNRLNIAKLEKKLLEIEELEKQMLEIEAEENRLLEEEKNRQKILEPILFDRC